MFGCVDHGFSGEIFFFFFYEDPVVNQTLTKHPKLKNDNTVIFFRKIKSCPVMFFKIDKKENNLLMFKK